MLESLWARYGEVGAVMGGSRRPTGQSWVDIVISWGEKYLGQLFVREGRGVHHSKVRGNRGSLQGGGMGRGGGEHCMGEGRGEARSGRRRVVWGRI